MQVNTRVRNTVILLESIDISLRIRTHIFSLLQQGKLGELIEKFDLSRQMLQRFIQANDNFENLTSPLLYLLRNSLIFLSVVRLNKRSITCALQYFQQINQRCCDTRSAWMWRQHWAAPASPVNQTSSTRAHTPPDTDTLAFNLLTTAHFNLPISRSC